MKTLVCMTALLLTPLCVAQDVGSREFTKDAVEQDLATLQHYSDAPACPNHPPLIMDGVAGSKNERGHLALDAVTVGPTTFKKNDELIATVRLRNAGEKPVRIPWTPTFTELGALDQKKSSFVMLQIHAELKTSRDSVGIYAWGTLYGTDSRPSTFLTLAPGEWVTLRFPVEIRCDTADCDNQLHPRDVAQLRLETSETLLTREVSGCDQRDGAYGFREVKGEPIPVSYLGDEGSK